VTTPPPAAPRTHEREERFGALRTIATILRIVAGLVVIGGTILAIIGGVSAFGEAFGSGLVALIGGLLMTAVTALVLLAYAEIIRLAIAVEHNTYRTAEAQAGRERPLP
jgi:amino acid transporter